MNLEDAFHITAAIVALAAASAGMPQANGRINLAQAVPAVVVVVAGAAGAAAAATDAATLAGPATSGASGSAQPARG